MKIFWITLCLTLISCEVSTKNDVFSGDGETDILNTVDFEVDNIMITCNNLLPSSLNICKCFPQCCLEKSWICQPESSHDLSVKKKEIVLYSCNSEHEVCDYMSDITCPAPVLLIEGECTEVFECPIGIEEYTIQWQVCEMEDGRIGQQKVVCRKGQVNFSPCIICEEEICDGIDNDCDDDIDEIEPVVCEGSCGAGLLLCKDGLAECVVPVKDVEEICDYIDNDCDGEIDENQRNACNRCGDLSSETCNNVDDDCDGEVDEDVIDVCSTECGDGIMYCQLGFWVGCTARQPQIEICDGIDNDCDGEVDEDLQCLCTIDTVGVLFPCSEEPLRCGRGFKTCECVNNDCSDLTLTDCKANCYWLAEPRGSNPECDERIGIPIEVEICNNFDENCNNLIDEELSQVCYTGPPDTAGVGTCMPGVMICNRGRWGNEVEGRFVEDLCWGQRVPSEEICNGADDDCNGVEDWGEEIPDTDIVFVVDYSGSMAEEIGAILVALSQFALTYADEDALRWGLIVGPVSREGLMSTEILELLVNLTPFENFLRSFIDYDPYFGDPRNLEMLLDAIVVGLKGLYNNQIYDIDNASWRDDIDIPGRQEGTEVQSVPDLADFRLDWRDNADRVMIIFTDEEPQSYLNPPVLLNDIDRVCRVVPNLKIYVFNNDNPDWRGIAFTCHGQSFELSQWPDIMYNDLMTILSEICRAND